VFSQLSGYLKVVRRSEGFFAYDPQTDVAFDPEQTSFRDHAQYDKVVKHLTKIAAEAAGTPKKRWWRLW
jgi:hypothetical protein